MSQWRGFNATNKPDTCLWCGQKLRRRMVQARHLPQSEHFERAARGDKPINEPQYDKPGDYGDGHFCGLRCAYQFAVLSADGGQRFHRTARKVRKERQ